MTDFVDERYKNQQGLRWWPESELVRFIGKTYGATHGQDVMVSRRFALDIGSGTGRNSWLLAEAGFFVDGYEGSVEAIKLARAYRDKRQLRDVVLFHEWNGPMLPRLLTESYNLVIDCQTIQHFSDEDHRTIYEEIARVLKPGGRFWTMHWRDGNPDIIYDNKYPELRRMKSDELATMLSLAGLEVIENERISRTYQGQWMAEWHVMSAMKP